MKRKMPGLLMAFFVLVFFLPVCGSAKVKAPKKECHAYVVMDAGSGKVLFGQKENKKIYPASTAKLMTAIVCIEQGDVDSMIKTKSEIVNGTTPGAYSLGLPSGVKFSFKDLLNLSLIASAADATDSLADAVFGSKKKCAEAMNEKCKELGLKKTSFDNPVGNDIGAGFNETYATAREMALVTRYAMSIPLIREVVARPGYTTRYGADINVNTTNWFIRGTIPYDEDIYRVIGSKSGTTIAAGNVFIATAMDREGHEVICAYFGNVSKESTFRSIRSLLDYTFEKYKKGKLTLTKSAYDVRCDGEAGEFYSTYADLGCLPGKSNGQYLPNNPITRNQLARMIAKVGHVKRSRGLKSFVASNKGGKVTSLRLARLHAALYPNDYLTAKKEKEVLKKCKGIKGLSKEDRSAFASYVAYGLAPDETCCRPGQVISRKQALLYTDHLMDYQTGYDIRHPRGAVGGVREDGSLAMSVISLNDRSRSILDEQFRESVKEKDLQKKTEQQNKDNNAESNNTESNNTESTENQKQKELDNK